MSIDLSIISVFNELILGARLLRLNVATIGRHNAVVILLIVGYSGLLTEVFPSSCSISDSKL